MNIALLTEANLLSATRARVTGRQFEHIVEVHRAQPGKILQVGLLNGLLGQGQVTEMMSESLEMEVCFFEAPPPKLPLTLILALPRPKVLNRVIASTASLGVSRIVLLNAWRVEKAYWKSPRMELSNLREQCLLGLEQAKDTVLPDIHLARLFRPFVEKELPGMTSGSVCLLAHPSAAAPCPRNIDGPVVLALGPEGGWIDRELDSLEHAGLLPVSLGPRILRTETAVASLVSRLF